MQLNQYYTSKLCSDRLVDSLSVATPKVALDLGFGAGDLLRAAKRRWTDINLVGVDLDRVNVLNARLDNEIDAIHMNGFSPDLPKVISDKYGDIDLLISNPPYFSVEVNSKCRKILKEAGLSQCISQSLKKVPAELIFLAQNLRMLTANGEMGIILPAGLISGERWKPLREYLFCTYGVSNIIQMPENSFKKTDAQTFIMTISGKKSDYVNSINLSHILESKKLKISISDAVNRADYLYYKQLSLLINQNTISSNDFRIFRGNRVHKCLKDWGGDYLHTSDLPNSPIHTVFPVAEYGDANSVKKGDIALARVGRRCLGRAVYVDEGCIPVSDCIIVIRPRDKNIGKLIWERISSQLAADYFRATSLGVGAKYLTHTSVREFLVKK
ncbi:N-6 DNA methylase [Pseudoalteromonas luteoviolacea]|uniref:N-6 DNA methylase n=1 Tax=Pseudoalteromonas luteoviolacea TaxID=43657 RepID=UPI001B3678D1|nr:N-6 DNA methylase [Pseudoalteromonas luteoviolacea]MBQ4812697.1 N-6 DNA methylase [Pseudoalteromonas luteoviolacea]